MKELTLINTSKIAIIDDEDYTRCMMSNWIIVYGSNHTSYRIVRSNMPQIPLANFIMKDKTGLYDHKDRNSLNNQKNNLRIATRSQNQANRAKQDMFKECSSQYKGVSWHKPRNKWAAYTKIKGKKVYLGLFTNEIEAARTYDRAALKYHGEFACLNFPKEDYCVNP